MPRVVVAGARQRGLSLVELMVSMVLGLLLLAVVMQVYLVNRTTFAAQEQQGLLQEGARFAMEFLARDVRMAGMAGCSSRRPLGQPLPVRSYLNSSAHPFDLQAVKGYEALGTAPDATYAIPATNPSAAGAPSSWTPSLPTATQLDNEAIAGSDVLVLTLMEPGVPLVSPFTSGSQIFVGSTQGFAIGDILMVTDCQQAQVFQATNVVAASGNIVGTQSSTVHPGNSDNLAERGPSGPFQAGAEVARLRSYTYFVAPGADGTPSLFREGLQPEGSGSAAFMQEELLSGVDSMQVQYGLDENHDFVVERYATADAVTDWQTVRAVRVGLLVRSPEEFAPDADGATYDVAGTTINPVDDRRQRRVFTSTIALRNRLL